MTNDFKYPTTYELREILSRIANRKFLNEFAQHRGLFVTHANQSILATELSNLFFDEYDLEIIRKEAYKESHSHTLSGFIINSKDKKFNLKTRYEGLRQHGKFDTGITLNQLTTLGESQPFDYKGSFEYIKKKPGRIEFLQDETNSFDFYLTDLKNGSWQVEVDCNRSADAKELRTLFVKSLPMSEHSLELIDQDLLSSELTISFFDALTTEGMSKEWAFTDVKQLTVKKGKSANDEDDEDDESEDGETKVLSKQELTGITQAILEGKNLREDPFVKNCEANGYRFSSMTYEFINSKNPAVISIKAEFKGRPKVFEVGINNIEETTGIDAIRRQSSMSTSDNRKIRSTFWNNAKKTFDSILNSGYKFQDTDSSAVKTVSKNKSKTTKKQVQAKV